MLGAKGYGWLAPLFILVFLAATLSYGPSAAAGADETGWSVTEVRGARLIFRPSRSDERGAIFAVMLAGQGHERENEVHCAHIAEHMVFVNPTGSLLSVREWLRGLGGTLHNGWTGWDHTQFEVVVADTHVPEALGRLVRAMFPESIDPRSYEKEMRDSLSSQLEHMTRDEVSGTLNFAIGSFYRGTPYDPQIFGTQVESVRPETVLQWMRREYSPHRLTVVVVAKADHGELVKALDSALEHVPPGPGPSIPTVRLDPPEYVAGRLGGARQPLFAVGFGVDELTPDDWLPVHVLLALAQNRLLSTKIPGLEAHEGIPPGSGVVTATTKLALVVYRVKDAAALPGGKSDPARTAALLRQLVEDSLSQLGPRELERELNKLRGTTAHGDTVPSVPVPSTLIEAWSRGIQEVAGPGYITSSEDLSFLLSPEGTQSLASAAARHLPRVKVMVAYVEPDPLRSPLVWAGAALAIIVATLVVVFMLRRYFTQRAGA